MELVFSLAKYVCEMHPFLFHRPTSEARAQRFPVFISSFFCAISMIVARMTLFLLFLFFQYIYAVYMCFKSSPLTLAALCSLCVQPGRCSQRGSSTRAGAAATARRSRPILRVSKTNEPVWRAAQAAEVLHLFQSQQRLCQEAGHHVKNLL